MHTRRHRHHDDPGGDEAAREYVLHGDESGADGGGMHVSYREIAMPGCDRAMMVCLVLTSLVVLAFSIAAFVKSDQALQAILAAKQQ